jgi:16S rRNA (uracil1498-N3)-methyltransferase
MHRFFLPSRNISDKKIIIKDKGQVHHLKDVLRFEPKDEIIIFDEQGNEYHCIIEKLSDKATLGIKNRRLFSESQSNSIKITVACAIPKNSKMDDIIDKLTQLGVYRIIPLETKHVIVNLNDKKKEIKLMRWQKVIISASLQSQRKTLPILGPITDIQKVLSETKEFDLKLIPTLLGPRISLKEIMSKAKYKNILVFIGPEGDFTPSEIAVAVKRGCIPVTLGKTVLRVETAAVAVTGFIKLYADH